MEKKQVIIFAILVTIVTIIFISTTPFLKKSELPKDITSSKKETKKEKKLETALERQQKIIQKYKERKRKKIKPARVKKISSRKKYQKLQREKSEAAKKKFLKEIYLKGKLPRRLIYSEMDVDTDDPVKIMIGENPYEDEHLVVAGTTVVPPKPEDVITYINDYKNAFPHINKSLLSQLKPTIKINSPRPGLKSLNVWEAHDPKTDRAEIIVYLARSDERGSYIISYSGKTSMIEENEDYIDQLLLSLETKKAPKNIYNQQ